MFGNDSFDPAPRAPAGGGSSGSNFAAAPPAVKAEDLNREELKAEKEAKKAAAREEKMKNYEEQRDKEIADKKDRLEAGEKLKVELDAWCLDPTKNTWRDVRTLLGNMHDVVWEGANWTKQDLGDLMMNPAKVKKARQRAILIAHPDKHKDADGARRYRAERIFEAVNESWKKYEG